MKAIPTRIPDVILIEPTVFSDPRGFFLEVYHQEKYRAFGIDLPFVQDNHSRSSKGTLRGLHFQVSPQAQGKLVRAIEGEIFDVAVDIRPDSKTFGRWVGENLSAENHRLLWVPPGFAHGFYVLSDFAQVEYKCTALYDVSLERGIRWDDPDIAVQWPLQGLQPLLSKKDENATFLRDMKVGK